MVWIKVAALRSISLSHGGVWAVLVAVVITGLAIVGVRLWLEARRSSKSRGEG